MEWEQFLKIGATRLSGFTSIIQGNDYKRESASGSSAGTGKGSTSGSGKGSSAIIVIDRDDPYPLYDKQEYSIHIMDGTY